jgi:signal peptidase I
MTDSQAADPAVRWPSPGRLLAMFLAAALVVIAVRVVLVQSFVVPTGSMEPTVEPGQRVLVSRLSYLTGDIHRGDVIVFDGTGVFVPRQPPSRTALASFGRGIAAALGVPVGDNDFLKRVIGLPGDRVTCCDAQGRITVNGAALDEPYLAGEAPSRIPFDIEVPAERLWVMGDHRGDSADSRAHLGDPGGGMVPVKSVVGRVIAVWWPLSQATGVGGGSDVYPARASGRQVREEGTG